MNPLVLKVIFMLIFITWRALGVKKKIKIIIIKKNRNAIRRAKDAMGNRIQRELWNANGQIQRTYICIWWGRISDEYINCWTLQAITFFPYKIFLAKISTRNNKFNYDNLWLDCFHGFWSRDFYWPFGEYIYIYIYMYI